MSTSAILKRIAEQSPRSLARMAGVCQLLAALTATFGSVLVPGKLFVTGDAAATSANILDHTQLFWWGFASSIAGVLFHVAWALLLYDLLKPVNRRVSLFAALVMVVACSIQALASFLYLGPFVVLQSGGSLNAFSAEQLKGLALVFVRLSIYAVDIFLVFFGFWLVLTAFLIFKSTFLPRILGVLLAIAGLAWMVFLVPPVATQLFTFIASASAIGEIPLELWLIVMAVNEQKWKEQALAAAS